MAFEEPLAGGFGNQGAVTRRGDIVLRPPRPSTLAVRTLLVHLEDVGFEGAPRYLGTGDDGREWLSYIEGDCPLPPYPAWAMTDEVLISVAHLLRDFHEAVSSFDPGAITGWELDWADPGGGPSVCHNDTFPENIVFRDGRAVALIDFDMAGPGRPFWDLAVATQEWMPLHAPDTRRDHPLPLDSIARFGTFARAYGVRGGAAEQLVDVVVEERAQALGNIRSEVARGDPVWTEQWDADEEARAAIDDRWLAEQRDALIRSVESG